MPLGIPTLSQKRDRSPSQDIDGRLLPMLGAQSPYGQLPLSDRALQDYQLQLTMLEAQHKKRVMMARQEAACLVVPADASENVQAT